MSKQHVYTTKTITVNFDWEEQNGLVALFGLSDHYQCTCTMPHTYQFIHHAPAILEMSIVEGNHVCPKKMGVRTPTSVFPEGTDYVAFQLCVNSTQFLLTTQ